MLNIGEIVDAPTQNSGSESYTWKLRESGPYIVVDCMHANSNWPFRRYRVCGPLGHSQWVPEHYLKPASGKVIDLDKFM